MKAFLFCISFFVTQCMFSSIKEIYCYNLPFDTITFKDIIIEQKPYIEIICDSTIHDGIIVEAYNEINEMIFKKSINNFSEASTKSLIKDNLYSYFFDVQYLNELPKKIIVKDINNLSILKTADCKYINIRGKVNCASTYTKLYLNFFPNGFNDPDLFQQTSPDGSFSIMMPQRKYNCLHAIADTYGQQTLENWVTNFDGRTDTISINFDIHNAEIYNLHAWENNGGGNSLFISFRPMCLQPPSSNETIIGNDVFSEMNFNIPLEKENITVRIDGKEMNIISVQPFYETGVENRALKSYIVQIDYDKRFRNKLLSVEFNYNDFRGESRYILKFLE